MAETRRKFDRDFREGAVRLVRETGKSIAQVARDLGINEGTLGNWVNADKRRRGDGSGVLDEDERAELARLPTGRYSSEAAVTTKKSCSAPTTATFGRSSGSVNTGKVIRPSIRRRADGSPLDEAAATLHAA